MTERPEATTEASADEEAPPQADAEAAPPEAAATAEALDAQTGVFDTETDDAAVDEVEAELEADEATDEDLDEQEAEEAEALTEGADDDEVDEFEPEPGSAAAGVAAGAAGTAAVGAAAGAAETAVSRRRGAPAPSAQRAPTQSELAVHVTDNASRFFVIATVVVFVAILAFGLLGGHGGLLTATPAPPTAAPSVSAEPSA